MKIGVLFCAYNCVETVHDAMMPWVFCRLQKFCGDEFIISAVSVPFKEYEKMGMEEDQTTRFLAGLLKRDHIDYLADKPKYITEAAARNLALEPLLAANVDLVILWDGDEIPALEQVMAIINFIKSDPWCVWFSFSYKNYVFDNKTYLLEAFTPPRAFRVKTIGHEMVSFSWDNDITYKSLNNNIYVDYRKLPTKIIPKSVAWIKHLTWLNSPKTKRKVAYQKEHFLGQCSYKWNNEKNCLEFDPDYFARHRIALPPTAQDVDDIAKSYGVAATTPKKEIN